MKRFEVAQRIIDEVVNGKGDRARPDPEGVYSNRSIETKKGPMQIVDRLLCWQARIVRPHRLVRPDGSAIELPYELNLWLWYGPKVFRVKWDDHGGYKVLRWRKGFWGMSWFGLPESECQPWEFGPRAKFAGKAYPPIVLDDPYELCPLLRAELSQGK